MERIHQVLRKIQDIYYNKNQKQLIDVDLMLDYTKVLYADLLEWKSKLASPETTIAPPTSGSAPVPLQQTESENVNSKNEVSVESTENLPSERQEEEDTSQADAPINEEISTSLTAQDEEEIISSDASEAPPKTVESESLEKKETASVPEIDAADPVEPEETIATTNDSTDSVEEDATIIQNDNATEKVKAPQIVINDDDFPSLEEEDTAKVSVPKKDHPAVKTAINFEPPTVSDNAAKNLMEDQQIYSKAKDIRSVIGINDKYQFMNELFHNNKSNYEELLDKINAMDSSAEAERWLSNEVAAQHHWVKDDETFQALLGTVKKHFQ